MSKSLEGQKSRLKETLSKTIDEYYETFAKRSSEANFTIDQIEELMLEQQKKINETLKESNSELTSSIKTEVKKNAINAADI